MNEEPITHERFWELKRLTNDKDRDHQRVALELVKVVEQLHIQLATPQARTAPYPDCELQISVGTDGWQIGWKVPADRGGHRVCCGIRLDRNEAAWVAESFITSSYGRSLIIDRFRHTNASIGLQTIASAKVAIDDLHDRYTKSMAALKEVVGNSPLPEAKDATKIVEGGPLPGEFHDDCPMCEERKRKYPDEPCWGCQDSGKVWIRPAPKKVGT